MSWLSPEKRALFQQIQEAQRIEDEAAALQAHFQKLPDVGPRSIVTNRTRMDGEHHHVEQQRHHNPKDQNWMQQRPQDVYHGPDSANAGPSHGPNDAETAEKTSLQQQSSGNIARKLYDEEFIHRTAKSTSSTPALHLENFVARSGPFRKQSNTEQTVPQVKSGDLALQRQSIARSEIVRRSSNVTERRSSDRPNAMMFVDSNGSYHPPSPTARISSTKTQRLREEQLQLARMRQESQARFSKPRPALKLKVSDRSNKPDEVIQRRETYDHGARIVNSRTSEHRPQPSLPNASERYANFRRQSGVDTTDNRSGAKKKMVEKKMNDVFRRLGQDVTSPPLHESPGKDRMPTAKNTVSHTVYRNSAQLSELAQPRVLSHHNTPKTVRKVSAVPRKAPGIQVSSKLSANTGQKTVHTRKNMVGQTSKTGTKRRGKRGRKNVSKLVHEASDTDATSTSDNSSTSVDSSTLSFPTETTSEISETTVSQPEKTKKKKKAVRRKTTIRKVSVSLYKQNPNSESVEKVRHRISERSSVAFGSALPRAAPTTTVSQGETNRKLIAAQTKKPSVQTRQFGTSGFRRGQVREQTVQEISENEGSDESSRRGGKVSGEYSEASGTSEELTESTSEDEPAPNPMDIIRSLTQKLDLENKNDFASNSQVFHTPDSR